ncbi:holo-ACP synthase [Vibrio caribbeanicus]|uniref:Holo-[acyl-carrier-protein] synthase n=1 Tax=Vibrio caribbeanicus ATCC BAA-2122 TaxID=796620 RepID=E3BFS2_9VIBR|nr:holo-ACP synthase [Vibrio caribbeanicus]EFP98079.1 4'-phosphopantetheinyl transferase [Vibrio caribbeanicus ATCC BAA-2122]
MAIVGLGTDISEIQRIEKAASRNGDAFAQRILTQNEFLKYQVLKQKTRFLAKRFAAKEAAAKALGTGIACGVSFHDFEITNNELGKPELHLSNQAAVIANTINVRSVHLSISDERHYAVATVILEN